MSIQLQENLHKEILREDPKAMLEWPAKYRVSPGYPPNVVQAVCVDDDDWQRIRLSMKGVPTHRKLAILKAWWDKQYSVEPYYTEVQVGNYLGALRRGGQLDMFNRVRKYL